MAAPQKKVAVKKTASKKKVSGEFKDKSGSSPKKVKAFKKPDLIVKQKSVSKKLLGAGLGLFASGAIAGTLAASLLKKKSAASSNSSESQGKKTTLDIIREMTESYSGAIEAAENKSESLKIENSKNIVDINKKDAEIDEKKIKISSLESDLDKANERIKKLVADLEQRDARIQGLASSLGINQRQQSTTNF
jgi:septal ring factor EnvC (AmiA/AmiB activator)